MKKFKNKLPRAYRNIVILFLILLVFFSVSGSIFNYKKLSVKDKARNRDQILGLYRPEKIEDDFFIGIIQHIFPNKMAQKQYKPIFSIRARGRGFFANIFKIDLSNPLTYIQAQFPVAAAHHQLLMENMPENKSRQEEEDWSREIHFVDYEGDEKTRAVDSNLVGDGDMEGHDHSLEEDNIVDSLEPISIEDLAGIEMPKPIKLDKDKASILIYHTHGTESYKPMSEGNYHSLKKEYTVIEAASIIGRELEKRGHKVIHDTSYHDYPSYNGSYGRSLATAKSILEENPSIKIILDIHRDGYDKIDTRKDRVKLIENSRIKINNDYVARFQFVVGATSENRKEVEKFAHFVKGVSDKKYPGFSKDVLVKQYGSYNQYLSDYAALIELGSNANTIEEAKGAAYYLADLLAHALDILQE